ncbi:hypothetical protein C8R44DRAFT_748632 [Mycena epipterygia]|nr:hypothetical protein C8R44DRAFT_748632 [Mycena epipterygia]
MSHQFRHPMTSSINLNSCVGNTNGELTAQVCFADASPRVAYVSLLSVVCSGNNFSSSCENIGFSGITLSSACLDDAGNRAASLLTVPPCRHNFEGRKPSTHLFLSAAVLDGTTLKTKPKPNQLDLYTAYLRASDSASPIYNMRLALFAWPEPEHSGHPGGNRQFSN